jgi:hypothetical protein
MPSKSKKQHNLMAAVANNPAFAKKVGISKSVGEEFMKADKTKKFKNGDLVEVDSDKNPGLSKLPTEVRNKMGYMKKGGMAMKKGMHKMADGKMMKNSDMPKKKMNMGGMADMAQDKKTVKKAVGMHEKQLHGGKKSDLAKLKHGGRIASKGEHSVQKQSKRGAEMVKMKSGGMAKCARGGGIEVRGKTKGKIC